jgi:hypothetical protein
MPRRIDQRARAERVWPILVDTSRLRMTITYGDLSSKVGLHHRAARHFLAFIQEQMRVRKLPPIQALVVNQRTREPGAGLAVAHTGKAWQRQLAKVYAHRWPTHAPFGRRTPR